MPNINEQPPAQIANELAQLSIALGNSIPEKNDTNIIIATWNIRKFGGLTRQWLPQGNYSPKRDLRALRHISETVKRFDVCAIQEVTGNLRAIRDMMKFLGDDWSFLMTDVTQGSSGNKERLAFVYNNKRIQTSGLACELVISPENIRDPTQINKQFARTPYAVSFKAGKETFILVTLHIKYGNNPEEREPELRAIAKWLKSWANQSSRYHQNLLVLGDFNIDRKGDSLWKAFTSTGLHVPSELNEVKRSIFTKNNTSPTKEKFYDQIAWFKSRNNDKLNMKFLSAGGFDFLPFAYQEQNLSTSSKSHRLSDHYPLWAEFQR